MTVPKRALLISSNTKTLRGEVRGWKTFVMHLAAANSSGLGNLCKYASTCPTGCIGTQGHLGMPAGVRAQLQRTAMFFDDVDSFLDQLYGEIEKGIKSAGRAGMEPCFRLNGTSDVPWERIKNSDDLNVFQAFPDTVFYDYTKYPYSDRRQARGWRNYHLTYSFNEGPSIIKESERHGWVQKAAQEWVDEGVNVAAVFGRYKNEKSALPERFDLGFGLLKVIDGDEDDLRFLDPSGVLVGLRAKFHSYDELEQGIATGFILPGAYRGRPVRGVRPNPPREGDEVVSGSHSLESLVTFQMMQDTDNDVLLGDFFGV